VCQSNYELIRNYVITRKCGDMVGTFVQKVTKREYFATPKVYNKFLLKHVKYQIVLFASVIIINSY